MVYLCVFTRVCVCMCICAYTHWNNIRYNVLQCNTIEDHFCATFIYLRNICSLQTNEQCVKTLVEISWSLFILNEFCINRSTLF